MRFFSAWNHQLRHGARQFSASARLSRLPSVTPLPPNPPDAGHAHLTDRCVVKISGGHATEFMNRLVCADVSAPSVEQLADIISAGGDASTAQRPSVTRQMFITSFLNTRGRIMFDSFIFRRFVKDPQRGPSVEFFVDVDRIVLKEFTRAIARLRGKTKVRIDCKEGSQFGVFAAWDRSVADVWSYRNNAPYLPSPPKSYGEDPAMSLVHCHPDHRAPGLGWRILGRPKNVLKDTLLPGKLEPLSMWQLRRYLCGVPEGQNEIFQDSAFPPQCNHDRVGGLSFFKPTYIGEKQTLATERKGITPVRIVPVQIYETKEESLNDATMPQYNPQTTLRAPTIGSQLQRHGTVSGRHIGDFIRSTGNVGLARCHLEMVSDLHIHGLESRFDPQAAYTISDVTRKRRPAFIKPFVPPWLAAYIRSESYWRAQKKSPSS